MFGAATGHRGRLRVLACAVAVMLPCAGCSAIGPPSTPDPPRLVVSLTFTDGHADQYEYARPVLASRGVPATFYIVSRWTDERRACCMQWWQVDDLYRDGNEIGGMGSDHEDLTTQTPGSWPADLDRKRTQVCTDRQRLVDRGYDARSFAYPAGAFATGFPDGSTPQDLVRTCGYLSARALGGVGAGTGPSANPIPPADPFALRTPDVRRPGPVQLADLTDAVVAAARDGGWLPFAFDRVCRRETPAYADCMASPHPVEDTTLGAFLDWLAASGQQNGAPAGTAVRTVRTAMGAPAQPVLPPRRTVVSLTFDDGHPSQYLLRPVLLDHGMRATFYINSAAVDRGNGAAMTWDQLRELAGDGNDIGGHTLSHVDLTKLDAEDKEREICLDRNRLLEQRLAAVSFAYPYGLFDAESQRIVRSCGYRSARAGGNVLAAGPLHAELLPPPDPFATSALGGATGPIALAELQAAVHAAAAHGGGWVQVVFHMVCRAANPDFDICMRTQGPIELGVLTEFIDWLGSHAPPGTEVQPVDAVLGLR